MGKVIVVVGALVVLLIVLRLMLSRRDRGTELFVTEARGRQSFDGPLEAGSLEDAIRALLRQRQKIQAIKLVRERTRIGLKEAKDAVEEFEVTDRLRLPGDAREARDAWDIKRATPGGAPGEFLAEARRLKERRRAIDAIKLIRAHTGLGLKEAKDLYDSL